MKKYAVIVYYTFGEPESEVYLFDTEEQACKYLESMWDYYYDFALEDSDFDEENSYCVENYAELVWEGTGKRIFEVVSISEPMKFD